MGPRRLCSVLNHKPACAWTGLTMVWALTLFRLVTGISSIEDFQSSEPSGKFEDIFIR